MKFGVCIRFLAAVSVAFVIGVLTILFLLPYDSSFKKVVETQVKQIFLHAFKSRLNGSVKHVNIVTGEIDLENVTVTSLENDNAWSWKSEQFSIQFSWLSYILRGKFDVSVSLNRLSSHSHLVDSHILIIDHLQSFIAGAEGFPATLKALTITKGFFRLIDAERKLEYSTNFNGSYGNIQNTLYVHLAVEKGTLFLNQHKMFDAFNGSMHISLVNSKQPILDAVMEGTLHLSHLPGGKNMCHIDGQWHKEHGQFFLHTSDATYAFSLYNWVKKAEGISGDLSCTIPLNYFSQLVPLLHNVELEGNGHCQMHIDIAKTVDLEGEIFCKDIRCGEKSFGDVQLFATYVDKVLRCRAQHCNAHSLQEDLHADLYYDEMLGQGTATIETNTIMPLWSPFGLILHNGSLHVALKDSLVTGSYHCNCTHAHVHDPWLLEGELNCTDSSMALRGNCATKKFDIDLLLKPSLALSHCSIYENKEKPLLDITYNNEAMQGIVDVALLKDLGATLFHYKLPGQGVFEITAERDGTTIKTNLILKEGNIRVPCTYTIVRDIRAAVAFDYVTRTATITEGVIELDKGNLECKRAVMRFDERGVLQSAYLPILLKKAFLTVQKDVFAVVSGFLLFRSLRDQELELQGNLIIDRSYCKKNIFSQFGGSQSVGLPFFNGIFSSENKDLLIDLTVETKKPVEVKTSFLEMQVQIDAALHGSLQNPELSGSLNLVNGTLAFPYRPLSITHGMLYFLPHQLYDPTVELIAKGKIRKYHVLLRCNGSLQHPNISFESTPPLSEEQIITLLLAGTEEGSLSLAMPALIMQKLQNVIFGPEQSALKLEGYFKSLLEPLKHIRFIPGFSDQSGRGGFRGSIEIDVNDQLRAMIQKNFSLSEDIKFEVEYFFSDDITFRGIRDERADFGGEVEMRWKF